MAAMTVKGVVGVSGGEIARYAISRDSILSLQTPPGTMAIPARGANIAENRNGIAERALKVGAEWVFYMDDDQVFVPDTLLRLLRHDKDIVSGHYVQRAMPFAPHVYDKEDERGWLSPRLLKPFDSGLHQALSVGAGCMLVKTKVFKAMTEAGLAHKNGNEWWDLGQMQDSPSGWGDDHHFCQRARNAGFEVWADLDVMVGHQMTGTLWPKKNADGTWSTILIQAGFNEPIAEWPAAMRMPLVDAL